MDFLLITRGLLAISVVIWHFSGYQSKIYPLLNLPGRTAVWIFFGISGYVIAYGFIHRRYRLTLPDLKDFYINRSLRIYPLFFFISLITLITEWIISGTFLINLRDIPSQLLLIQFNHSYTLNGVFWSLGIELQFYLIAPLIAYFFLINEHNRLFLPSLLYVISICALCYATHVMNWSFDGRNIISNLPHFIVGMLACQYVSKVTPNRIHLVLSTIILLGMLAYTNWVYHLNFEGYWSITMVLLMDVIIFLLVFVHANIPSLRLKNLGYSLSMLGILSYGVYAWHGFILKYIPIASHDILTLTLINVLTAYFSYRIVEKPFLKLKQEKNHAPIIMVIN